MLEISGISLVVNRIPEALKFLEIALTNDERAGLVSFAETTML